MHSKKCIFNLFQSSFEQGIESTYSNSSGFAFSFNFLEN